MRRALAAALAASLAVVAGVRLWPSPDPTDVPALHGEPRAAGQAAHASTPFLALASAEPGAPPEPGLDLPAAAESREAARPSAPAVTRGVISGRALGGPLGETPLARATLELRRTAQRADVRATVHTDDAGRFAFPALELGGWIVLGAAEGHHPARRVVYLFSEEAEVELDLAFPMTRELTVRLCDERGPLASVESIGLRPEHAELLSVAIGPPAARRRAEMRKSGARATACAKQEPAARGTCIELHSLSVRGDEVHLLFGGEVVASGPLPHVDGPMDLIVGRRPLDHLLGTYEVRVLESGSDAPIAGARVQLTVRGLDGIEAVTGEDGRASFSGVPLLGAHVRVSSPRYVPARASIEREQQEPCVLRVVGGRSISGRIVGMPPDADRDCGVGIWREDPGTSRAEAVRFVRIERAPDRFAVAELEAGSYRLAVVPDRYTPAVVADELHGPGGVVRVDVSAFDAQGVTLRWFPEPPAPWPDGEVVEDR